MQYVTNYFELQRINTNNSREIARDDSPEGTCPLLAKDSEWVDILQTPILPNPVPSSSSNIGDEEAVLQLVI